MKNVIQYLQSKETEERIIKLITDNIVLYQKIDTDEKIQSFSGLLYNQFVKECVQNNQYISLSNKTMNAVNDVYRELIRNLRVLGCQKYSYEQLCGIVGAHRQRLILAIKSNEYDDLTNQILIPCAEYSGKFQSQILRTDVNRLTEPVIDIGCGKNYELVKALRSSGYSQVYGLDQYMSDDIKILCSNWFDYSFLKNTWGTVIAHMSFSNHLRRSLINTDCNRIKYEEKYLEILESLKEGGVFIYTPSVKEIEDRIVCEKYKINYYKNINDENLDTVYVKKIL
jgi:hypothetical protein